MLQTGINAGLIVHWCVKTLFLITGGSGYISNPRAQIRLYD